MKTKVLLKEWRSFLNETKVVSLSEIRQEMIDSGHYKDSDIDILSKAWNEPSNQFISKYSQIIKNSVKEGHSVQELLNSLKIHYHKVYQNLPQETKRRIGLGDISFEDINKTIDAKSSLTSREIRRQCNYKNGKPVVGSYQDFDIVHSESDYIVIEPKTVYGSIAWANGKPNGEEETNEKLRVKWCTATDNLENNMFRNYAGNLHMFYVINSNYENDTSVNRKICLSFIVVDGEPKINESDSSSVVNADNKPLDKDTLNKLKTTTFFQKILKKIEGRKNTSFEEVYKKASLSQIKRSLIQMKQQKISKSKIKEEIENYIKYTEKADVLSYFYSNRVSRNEVLHKLATDKNKNFDFLLNKILKNKDIEDLSVLAETTDKENLIKYFLSQEDLNVKILVSKNRNLDPETRKYIVDDFISTSLNKKSSPKTLSRVVDILVYEILYTGGDTSRTKIKEKLSYRELKGILENISNESNLVETCDIQSICSLIGDIKSKHLSSYINDIDWWFNLIKKELLENESTYTFFESRYVGKYVGDIFLTIKNLPQSIINSFYDLINKLLRKSNPEIFVDLITYFIRNENILDNQYKNLIKLIVDTNNDLLITKFFESFIEIPKQEARKRAFSLSKDIPEQMSSKVNLNKLSEDLFNLVNKNIKDMIASSVIKELGKENCADVILEYIENNETVYTLFSDDNDEVFNEEDSFSSFLEKAKDVDFSEMRQDFEELKKFQDDNEDVGDKYEAYEDLQDKYEYFFMEFLMSLACIKGKTRMYNFLKSKGIDLAAKHIFDCVFFEALYRWDVDSFEELVIDEDGKIGEQPHFAYIFNRPDLIARLEERNQVIPESILIKKFIRLVLS